MNEADLTDLLMYTGSQAEKVARLLETQNDLLFLSSALFAIAGVLMCILLVMCIRILRRLDMAETHISQDRRRVFFERLRSI